MRRILFATAILAPLNLAHGESLTAPALGAASNFGHHWDGETYRSATELGINDFRDTIRWPRSERRFGRFEFSAPSTDYPERLQRSDQTMSLTVNWGHPFYDSGDTPYTAEGRAAFGKFARAALDAFPSIKAVEVGNEINGQNFVKGPFAETKGKKRAKEYFELLKATYEQVKPSHPKTRILGGATHSVPLGFIWSVLDLGGADFMDALAIHPYTTPPEQLDEQISLLRQHRSAADLPIEITEFGEPNHERAPDFLLRSYCSMALSGVSRAIWYPLNDRGDDMAPLVNRSGTTSAVGETFAFLQNNAAGTSVRDVSPDAFTSACLFDERLLIIWGEERGARIVGDQVVALTPDGSPKTVRTVEISESKPVMLSSDTPFALEEALALDPIKLVADSFRQFEYTDRLQEDNDPFERFGQRGNKRIDLLTLLGQEARGTLWTPYLGNPKHRPSRITSKSLFPGKLDIVHRYIASEESAYSLSATFAPAKRSEDGVRVTVLHNKKVLAERIVDSSDTINIEVLVLQEGDFLDVVVGPNKSSAGDNVEFRIKVSSAD